MSQSWKDAPKYPRSNTFELVRQDDGTFDLFWNSELKVGRIAERWLSAECTRFGVCGHEFESILRDVKQNGRAMARYGS